jgi:hypothetical protein
MQVPVVSRELEHSNRIGPRQNAVSSENRHFWWTVLLEMMMKKPEALRPFHPELCERKGFTSPC